MTTTVDRRRQRMGEPHGGLASVQTVNRQATAYDGCEMVAEIRTRAQSQPASHHLHCTSFMDHLRKSLQSYVVDIVPSVQAPLRSVVMAGVVRFSVLGQTTVPFHL